MDFTIASILLLDGMTNGAVYALLGLATVLVFTVTRVIFIPQGEFVAYGALTLAMLQTGKTPGTVWLLLILAGVAALMEWFERWRHHGKALLALRSGLKTLAFPLVIALVAIWPAPQQFPLWVQAARMQPRRFTRALRGGLVLALGSVVVGSGLVLDQLLPNLAYLRGDMQLAHLIHAGTAIGAVGVRAGQQHAKGRGGCQAE